MKIKIIFLSFFEKIASLLTVDYYMPNITIPKGRRTGNVKFDFCQILNEKFGNRCYKENKKLSFVNFVDNVCKIRKLVIIQTSGRLEIKKN